MARHTASLTRQVADTCEDAELEARIRQIGAESLLSCPCRSTFLASPAHFSLRMPRAGTGAQRTAPSLAMRHTSAPPTP